LPDIPAKEKNVATPVIALTPADEAARAVLVAQRSGTHQQEITSPSFSDLRTMKPAASPGFPVYPDLAQRLLTTTRHPDEVIAHVMAVCAGYAYSDADTLSMIMTRLGLEKNHCRMITRNVEPMLICSTAFLVQSSDGKVVILCYRGTDPLAFITWLTAVDADAEKVPLSVPGSTDSFGVRAGFYRNVRITGDDVAAALARALRGKSVLEAAAAMPNRLEALYITGHSLGGAMAAVATVRMLSDRAFGPLTDKLTAVYTFGQPMVGCPDFAEACADDEFLDQNVIRYRYRNDVVPSLPPAASGAFAHFGQEYRYQNGNWRRSHQPSTQFEQPTTQIDNLVERAPAPLAALARPLRMLRRNSWGYSAEDHLPYHYVSALTPPRVTSEFGD
jgi:hypothetical protein